MKARQNLGKWLAAALVAAAGMVLLGCPHNNLIDGGGGGASGGSRGGSGGVQLVVSNFVDGGPVADRTGWLGGPSRTIAPEHIDLRVEDKINQYVFVAYATGNGTWGPEFIDIMPGTGAASLGISDPGEWRITVEAYDVALLTTPLNQGGLTGTDRNTIMEKDTADKVQAVGNALVLSGSATVHVGSGSQATLSLTGDQVTSSGTVNVAVHFKNKTDVDEIFTSQKAYTVTARLLDPVTQQPVQASEQVLYRKGVPNPPGGQDVDTDPGMNGYEYEKYDSAQQVLTDKYKKETLKTNGINDKVLVYNPPGQPQQTPAPIPKGMYRLVVEVTTPDGDQLYWGDPAFYVDGNRPTTGVLTIDGIIGTPPDAPAGFDVYWQKPGTADQLAGYTATFVWQGGGIYAVGYELQLADITDIYEYNGDTNVKVQGRNSPFTDAQMLWEELENDADAFDKHVTTLDWRENPEGHLEIPRWLSGSLMDGSTALSLRLASGKVYSARIRSTNGSRSHSAWTYLNTGTPTAPTGTPQPTEFDFTDTNGIFGLVRIAYNLLGTMDMYTLKSNRSTDWKVNTVLADVKVEGEALLQVEQYTPGTPIDLDYGFEGEEPHAQNGDQVLTATGKMDIITTWLGWQDTSTGLQFGPVLGPIPPGGGPAWTKTDWTYDGHADLELKPVGAGGSDIKVNAKTAGTLDVITLDTVGFGTAEPDGTDNAKLLANLTEFTGGLLPVQAGVYKNAAGDRLVVVMVRTPSNGGYQYTDFNLYVSVGDKNVDKVTSTLTDKNGDQVRIDGITATLRQGTATKTSKDFKPVETDKPANAVFDDLEGVRHGNWFLTVVVRTGEGYDVSLPNVPVTILYNDEAATATIP